MPEKSDPVTGKLDSLCDVPGIRVGHAHDETARTGCTVILPEGGAVAGVDVRGSAPGTREIESLYPVRLVNRMHGLLLTGGSAFGLDASSGVQKFLEQQNVGFDVGVARVPIVPAAVIFDLAVGDAAVRPDKDMGYRAAAMARAEDASRGRLGAGCGATVGKVLGMENCMAGGVGQASEMLQGDVVIGALSVVNAFGDVVDPASGQILAGARAPDGSFADTLAVLRQQGAEFPQPWSSNTTLVVVATNAALSKEEITKVAQMAQDGLARAIRPVHSWVDGDIVFALSCGNKKANSLVLGAVAAEVVARSIVDAVRAANGS